MIVKITKGQSVRGLVSYLLADKDNQGRIRERHEVIGGTIIGAEVAQISRQYAPFRSMKPELKNVVLQLSLRLPEGESLTDEQWREVGSRVMVGLGYDAYTLVSHGPSEMHAAAVRIGADGRTVSDSRDFARSEKIVRQIERDYGLTQVAPSHLLDPERRTAHRRAPTREQLGMHDRTGKIAPSIIIGAAIDELTAQPISASAFVDALAERGINARANIASTGKMNGFSYDLDGIVVKSETIGKGYTWGNLVKRGLSYDKDRDLERLSQTKLGREIRSDIAAEIGSRADRDAGPDAGPDRAVAPRTGTDRQERGDIARPDRAERQRSGAAGSEHDDSAERFESGDLGREDAGRADGRGQGGQEPGGNVVQQMDKGLAGGPGDGSHSGSRVAAAATALDLDRSSDAVRVVAGHSGVGLHRVEAVVAQTLAAVPDQVYEIGLLRRDTGKIHKRELSAEQIMKAIPYLRYENAHGREVLFRPTDTRYVMLDDLNAEAVARMKSEGFAPALVVETSKANLQAWVTLPKSVTDTERTSMGKELARQYGGDTAATDWRRFGKLPGFTNRKPEHEFERGGRILAPFVRLVEAAGTVAERGAELIAWARQAVQQRVAMKRVQTIQAARPGAELAAAWDKAEADEVARRRAARLPLNWSGIDYVVAAQMLRAGYQHDDLVTHLAGRSARHSNPADYARRTVEAAAASNDGYTPR